MLVFSKRSLRSFSFNECFAMYPHTVILSLNDNEIEELPDVDFVAPALTTLYICNNRLRRVPAACFRPTCFPVLESLYLTFNDIGEVPAPLQCPALKLLYLMENNLTELGGLQEMKTCETIGLGYNARPFPASLVEPQDCIFLGNGITLVDARTALASRFLRSRLGAQALFMRRDLQIVLHPHRFAMITIKRFETNRELFNALFTSKNVVIVEAADAACAYYAHVKNVSAREAAAHFDERLKATSVNIDEVESCLAADSNRCVTQ
jgi:hypothetical protein